MLHRSCRCVFLITGALMLLLALVLALNIDFDTTPTQAYQVQRAQVAQAVNRLETGCLTCHELVNAIPSNKRVDTLVELASLGPNNQSTRAKKQAATAPLLHAQLNTQLIETGQRILKLPNAQAQRAETVMADYICARLP